MLSIAQHRTGLFRARRMLEEGGFKNVTTKKFEPDIEHVYYTALKV